MSVEADIAPASIDARLFVSAVGKALKVLEVFNGTSEPLSLKEISERTRLGRSATQRQLYTLKMLGYLLQDKKTARFRVSLKAIRLANSYLISDELLRFSLPYLIEANKVSEQTINIYRRDDLSLILVQRVAGQQILNPTVTIGSSFPLFATAPGRVLLAYSSDEEVLDVLKRSDMRPLTPYTNATVESVMRKIADARKNGYALLDQEAVMGNLSVAAPIFDRDKAAVAAVSLSGPAAKSTVEEFEKQFAPIVTLTARSITIASGGIMP